jgi:SAM-dependent methyltransferase
MSNDSKSDTLAEAFFREYTSGDAIEKYSRPTAGYGINYLLEHDYKAVYLDALQRLPETIRQKPIRMLEFGCGAGMNLLHLVSVLRSEGFNVAEAIGTDFSPVLVEVAAAEAKSHLHRGNHEKLRFLVARNETLLSDLSLAIGKEKSEITSSFHFIFGVNTVRYCHAAGKELENARDIFQLLPPGGVCVIIDMNSRFPLFRSDLKNKLRLHKEEECYVPSLEEYAAPFTKVGFELLRKEHFCWVPHSSGNLMCKVLSALSPILDVIARSRAMRSLVVARKPA